MFAILYKYCSAQNVIWKWIGNSPCLFITCVVIVEYNWVKVSHSLCYGGLISRQENILQYHNAELSDSVIGWHYMHPEQGTIMMTGFKPVGETSNVRPPSSSRLIGSLIQSFQNNDD